ncbi:MAG: hypothetical protein AAB473_01105 [Patescibacteria group bacterium]
MKNKDLELAEKATEINRQRFVERLAYCNGDAIAQKLRTSIGIPAEGFETAPAAAVWLRPDGIPMADVARRHMELKCAIRVMLEKLKLAENYHDAVRYFLVLNKIRHIPGNFSVTITAGSKRIEHAEDMPLATGEKRLRDKLVKDIHEAMGHKSPRSRPNAEENAKVLKLHHQKGVINGIDSDTGEPIAMIKTNRDIAAQMNVDDEFPSKAKEDAEVKRIKLQKHRAKKRFH